MLILEILTLCVLILAAVRMPPPTHSSSPRLLSALAAGALGAFGVALSAIMIVPSTGVFGAALLVAGLCTASFLWLMRGGFESDDEDGGEPTSEPPGTNPDGSQRRFLRKRVPPSTPRTPSGRL
ncbi:MAG: hypothetical protein EXQ67_06790 [Thermoleophilia bacterium]|nr:hypothetical protein [Thermoleophilia bacterium]